MKLFTNLKLVAVFALLATVPLAAGAFTEYASAHDGEDHSHDAAQADEKEEENKEDKPAAYNYTAQAGDTYSQIARKAVQTYGLVNNVNLSQAQIVFAETNLTIAADSPLLNEGQAVSVQESAVKEWVEKAEKLTDEQKSAWAEYTVGVDFNTNNVGEKRE